MKSLSDLLLYAIAQNGPMTTGQIADVLGCSAGTVKSQAARGLDRLRAVTGLTEEEARR